MTRTTGWTFLLFPVAVQVPFGLLAAPFDYPGVLRRPAAEVLAAFAAGGPALVWTWYAYALVLVPFLATIAALPVALAGHPRVRLLRAVTALGVVSAAVQVSGLLRWTLLVPVLARARSAGVAPEAVDLAFAVQHQLFGVLLGEHVGQLLLALWTAGSSWALRGPSWVARIRTGLGLASAGLFVVGLADGLGTVGLVAPGPLAQAPVIAFACWSIWSVAVGLFLLRQPATAS